MRAHLRYVKCKKNVARSGVTKVDGQKKVKSRERSFICAQANRCDETIPFPSNVWHLHAAGVLSDKQPRGSVYGAVCYI